MDNFLNYINQPASPLFIMVGMGLTGFAVIAFAFIYDRYETKRTKEKNS